MGVVEAFDEPVSDRVRHCLVAMAFLEVESGPGEGVLDVVDDAGWVRTYARSMEGMSLGM